MPKFARILLITSLIILPLLSPPKAQATALDSFVEIFRGVQNRLGNHRNNVSPLFNPGEERADPGTAALRPMAVPEFGTVTGIIAIIGSGATYFLLRKKT